MVVSAPLIVQFKGRRPCVVLVNFTSVKGTRFDDLTCVYTPQDHAYFKRDSYVFYRNANVEFADSVVQNVNSRIWRPQQDFTATDVSRIVAGLRSSPHTPLNIKSLPI